jgi:predicted metal-binding protein
MTSEFLPNSLRKRFLKLCHEKHISESVGIKEAVILWICMQEATAGAG